MATVKISELPAAQVVGNTTANDAMVVKSGATNGAAAVGVVTDTSNAFSTDGAKAFEVRQGGTKIGATERNSGADWWTLGYVTILGGTQTYSQNSIKIDGANLQTTMGQGWHLRWTGTGGAGGGNGTPNAGITQAASGILAVTNGTTGGGALQFTEQTAPAAGAANTARLFCQDNGAGKSQLCVIFNTGAIQVIATEP